MVSYIVVATLASCRPAYTGVQEVGYVVALCWLLRHPQPHPADPRAGRSFSQKPGIQIQDRGRRCPTELGFPCYEGAMISSQQEPARVPDATVGGAHSFHVATKKNGQPESSRGTASTVISSAMSIYRLALVFGLLPYLPTLSSSGWILLLCLFFMGRAMRVLLPQYVHRMELQHLESSRHHHIIRYKVPCSERAHQRGELRPMNRKGTSEYLPACFVKLCLYESHKSRRH